MMCSIAIKLSKTGNELRISKRPNQLGRVWRDRYRCHEPLQSLCKVLLQLHIFGLWNPPNDEETFLVQLSHLKA